MISRNYKVLLEWDPQDEVWVSYVPDVNYLSSYGDTREEAIANTREAILGYIEAAEKDGLPIPESSHEGELIDLQVAVA
jgi:predicted RNase H-like HicB family nuclease